MIYFYAQESAKTPEKPKPSYIFPLEKLGSYFGKNPDNIRKAVLNSDEYKAYAAEHSQPPPPPEMSLLTKTLVTLCPRLDPQRPLNAAGSKRAAPDPEQGCGSATRFRDCRTKNK